MQHDRLNDAEAGFVHERPILLELGFLNLLRGDNELRRIDRNSRP